MNTGHVEFILLFIEFRSVCLGGINADWWRYLMSAALDVMSYSLYAMCLVWSVCVSVDVLLYVCGGNIRNLVFGYRPPFHTIFLL